MTESMTVGLTGMESGQNLPCCISQRNGLNGTFGQNGKEMHTWAYQKPDFTFSSHLTNLDYFMNISSVHYFQEQLLSFSMNYVIPNYFPDQLLDLIFFLTRRGLEQDGGRERSRHRAEAGSNLATPPEQRPVV